MKFGVIKSNVLYAKGCYCNIFQKQSYELNFFWVGNLKHRKRKHKITSFVLGKNTPRASAINLGVRGDGHE